MIDGPTVPVQSRACLTRCGDHILLQLELANLNNVRLRLVHRNGSETIVLRLDDSGASRQICLPDVRLLATGRWDLWIDSDEGGAQRLNAELPSQSAKHFFSTVVGDRGFSAYLTDSKQSVALFVEEAARHKEVCTAEDARQAYPNYLVHLPVIRNMVFFESFLGKAYAGNPRYVYEYLLKTRPDLQFVWAYNGKQTIPGSPQVVRRGSADYYRLLAQAAFRVNNIRFPVTGRKEETIYLQTWHGTPLKRLSFDIAVSGPEVRARDALYDESQDWSLLLSENPYSTEVLARAFRYQGDILEAGYPLTDTLINCSASLQSNRRRALELPEDKRLVLYAPTWRDDKSYADWQHEFDLNLDLELVASALPADMLLILKAHHLVSERLDQSLLPANVRDLSHVEDINELCQVADVLITDYSSVFFDFAVTGRPILFYCYDLEHYANHTRGLYLDVYADLPGPVVRSTSDLLALLNALASVKHEYASRYARFRQRFCALNDGSCSRRVVEHVFGQNP